VCLLNFLISKLRFLDVLRFERVSSLFSASFFFASFLLCFSALLFFSGHPTITPSFNLPFASRIACELQVNRMGGGGGGPISSVQFSCSKSYMGDRVIILCSLPLLLLLHISIPLLPGLFPS